MTLCLIILTRMISWWFSAYGLCHNLNISLCSKPFFRMSKSIWAVQLGWLRCRSNSLTIRLREAKGGKDGIANIADDCANLLRQYFIARPPLSIDGRMPLFYTDFRRRWDRKDLYRMFMYFKKKAGVRKPDKPHVFARHTPATILVANGCDIRIVKDILRHNDIRTTLRYAHLSDKTKRERYEQCQSCRPDTAPFSLRLMWVFSAE